MGVVRIGAVDELRVLGPVELVVDGAPVALPAMHRRLLAALVVAGGRPRSLDELADALWEERPPASARKLLQLYVSQLRKALPPSIAIKTLPAAYVLDLDPKLVDAARFEVLLADAVAARHEGNHELAGSLARRALALWRGRAFGDLAYEMPFREEAERLEELRLAAAEERCGAEVELGHHADVAAELVALADANPLRERLHELTMLALYRCGRQADALDRYRVAHERLDELGLEPGGALKALQLQVLRNDPALDPDPGTGSLAKTLPVPPTALVGRERELAQLVELVERREARLVVLTGAGGTGKTRLALEAARRVAGSFANGAVLVELAPLLEPELVVPTIAQAVGVADAKRPLEALAEALRPRELLLLLDNAEHVRDAAPAFVELLRRAPRLTLLVTSRAVLHVTGEHVFPVPPLDDAAALELFERRARLLQPGFRVTPENRGAVQEICRRVDGLPLAIELAAARVRVLAPEEVLSRLGERLAFLAGGPRDLPARQQTLHETLDWSYDLLSAEERGLLARLSVFRGGATLPAVAAVCAGSDEDTAHGLLERLADVSLLLVRRQEGETRYDLLETVRQYAAERLEQLDAQETRRLHAEWFLEFAEQAETELSGEHQTSWFSQLEAEHDNERAALAALMQDGERELALRLTVALSRFWYVRGHLVDARRQLDAVLPGVTDLDPLLLRRAQTAGASIALLQGDYSASTVFAESALDSARRAGEPRFVANALSNLGAIVLAAGDETRAATVLDEAVALARAVGDQRIIALALNNLGDLALATGDYRRAAPLFQESLELLRARGDTANIARSLFNSGAVALMLRDVAVAESRFREAIALAREADDQEDLAWCLEGFAALAALAGDGERAATLSGAARALLRGIGAEFKPFERRLHASTEERARTLCGADLFDAALDRGGSLPLDEVLDLALGVRPSANVVEP